VFGWLLSLFRGGSRRVADSPIGEEDAYTHSYGDRSGEILSVERIPASEPERIPRRTGDMTGELLRRAFESKLDARKRTPTA